MRVKLGRRALWLSVMFLLMLSALGGRLYQLQIVKAEAYSRAAHHQRALSLPVASRRGMILDRRGMPLTDPKAGWGVAVFPPLVKDGEGTARALGAIFDLSEQSLQQRFAKEQLNKEPGPFWVAEPVSAEVASRVRAMRLPGVIAAPVGVRYGPRSLARHLVGYVNEGGGVQGLERLYEKDLSGEAVPTMVAYLDGNGRPMAGLGVRAVLPQVGKEPYQVHTTIDGRLQREAERVLDSRAHPDGGLWRGAVVVLDPHTGELLAMASRPQYDQVLDPGKRADDRGDAFLIDRATSQFEPGSVFKAVVAAAALEGNLVTLDEKFYCPGHYEVGEQRFADAGGTAHGWITFREAIAKSCNITFARVGYERLGAQRLLEAARRFGFGTFALGLPGEKAGVLPALKYGGEVAQFSFGQGLLVTPLQVARAFAAIANGGTLPPLRLVTAIKNPAGRVMARPAAGRSERILSAQTVRALQMALVAVTDPRGSGTGRKAWMEGVGAAGKTGSAEGTERGRAAVHAWFAGYVPADAPKYVIVVMVQGGGAGGEVAAPIFREIGNAILAGGAR